MAQNSIENAISFFCAWSFSQDIGFWSLAFASWLQDGCLIPQHFLKQQYLKKNWKGATFLKIRLIREKSRVFLALFPLFLTQSQQTSLQFAVAMTGTPNAREAGRIRTWCFQSPCWMADSVCWEEVSVWGRKWGMVWMPGKLPILSSKQEKKRSLRWGKWKSIEEKRWGFTIISVKREIENRLTNKLGDVWN